MDLSTNHPLVGRTLSQIGSRSASQVCIAGELNILHEQQNVKKKSQIISEKIRKSVTVRAWKYGTQAARKWAAKFYPDHKFAQETERDWMARYQRFLNESTTSTEGSPVLFSLPRLGRLPTLSNQWAGFCMIGLSAM